MGGKISNLDEIAILMIWLFANGKDVEFRTCQIYDCLDGCSGVFYLEFQEILFVLDVVGLNYEPVSFAAALADHSTDRIIG